MTTFTCAIENEMNRYPYASEQTDKEINMVDSNMIASIHALKVSEIAERARAKGKIDEIIFFGEHLAKGWVQVDHNLI